MTGISPKMKKLLIFDFDGVVITGSNEGYFTCYHKALEVVGVKLNPNEERRRILEKWGKGYKLQIDYLLDESRELISKAVEAYEACYYSPLFTQNIKIIPRAPAALKKLSEKYKLAIASGMMRKSLDKYLKKYGITKYFEYVLSSDEIKNAENKKPSPYMLNMVLNHYHFAKDDAVYVGDGKGDVEMARNAGVEPVVVLTGHLTKEEAKTLKVKHIVPDITYLDNVL